MIFRTRHTNTGIPPVLAENQKLVTVRLRNNDNDSPTSGLGVSKWGWSVTGTSGDIVEYEIETREAPHVEEISLENFVWYFVSIKSTYGGINIKPMRIFPTKELAVEYAKTQTRRLVCYAIGPSISPKKVNLYE